MTEIFMPVNFALEFNHPMDSASKHLLHLYEAGLPKQKKTYARELEYGQFCSYGMRFKVPTVYLRVRCLLNYE
jgi:hypothetical protein